MHHHDKTISRYVTSPRTFQSVVLQTYNYSLQENKIIIVMSKVVKYIIYREIIHNLGYWFYFFPQYFGNVVVQYHLSCIMKQTSCHNCILFHFIWVKDDLPSPNRHSNTTYMKLYNKRFMLMFFLNLNVYQAKIMLCYLSFKNTSKII